MAAVCPERRASHRAGPEALGIDVELDMRRAQAVNITMLCSPASRLLHSGSGGEDLLALLAQLSLRPDVPVERHRPDTELPAEFGHRCVTVGHRSLGQPHLGFRQRELPAALAAARPAQP